jgi:hypothetical protein
MQNNTKINISETYKFIHHTLLRSCDTALHLLQKGADFAKEKNMDEIDLLGEKLAPDMFDLKKQFQIFSDNVLGGIARGVGLPKPSMPDTETSFAQLIERLQKTKEFIASIQLEKVEGIENLKIKLPWMPAGMFMDAETYFGHYVLQNCLFHLVTAYGILRHKGVQIGKQDYMGQLNFQNE